MYETITYEELKSLPREQKIEVLKELKALYPTKKKIAEKLGVNPANIYNMIARYAKEVDEEQPEPNADSVKKRRRRLREKMAQETEMELQTTTEENVVIGTEQDTGLNDIKEKAPEPVLPDSAKKRVRNVKKGNLGKTKTERSLLLVLSKSMSGEEAQALLGGISSIFLKSHNYRLEIRVSEE